MNLLNNGLVEGVAIKDKNSEPCEICVKGKLSRAPFNKHSASRATNKLELIHSDVCGPMNTNSIGSAKYFLTFTDDFSRNTIMYCLKNKSEVTEKFLEYKSFVENQCHEKIKCLRTDNGTEYVNKELLSHLKRFGIQHQTSVPYTQQQNGVAERLKKSGTTKNQICRI